MICVSNCGSQENIIYILSQLLSTAFMISFFFIYYGVVAGASEKNIYLLMIGFILYQEIWVNKELYKKLIVQQTIPHERGVITSILAVTMLIFLLPMFYIIISLF